MVGEVSSGGFFIVRQGEGDKATYAICHRVDSVSGGHQITGTNKTAQQLVDEQRLDAAFIASGDYDGGQTMSAQFATGEDIFIHIEHR